MLRYGRAGYGTARGAGADCGDSPADGAGQIFRGYRAATTALFGRGGGGDGGGAGGVCAGGRGGGHPKQFVLLWVIAAGFCLAAVGIEMGVRSWRWASRVQKQLTLLAVEQFVPSVAAGGLLTWVMCDFVPAGMWMLPGLWMMLFSLGMFASARLLPREVFGVAGFYLVAGVLTLVLTADAGAGWRYSPWLMGGVFGVGQLVTAGILYWRLEYKVATNEQE